MASVFRLSEQNFLHISHLSLLNISKKFTRKRLGVNYKRNKRNRRVFSCFKASHLHATHSFRRQCGVTITSEVLLLNIINMIISRTAKRKQKINENRTQNVIRKTRGKYHLENLRCRWKCNTRSDCKQSEIPRVQDARRATRCGLVWTRAVGCHKNGKFLEHLSEELCSMSQLKHSGLALDRIGVPALHKGDLYKLLGPQTGA
jgi:hypothetical protein